MSVSEDDSAAWYPSSVSSPRQPVDLVLTDGGKRHDDADRVLLLQHALEVGQAAEHRNTAPRTEVVVSNEAHDLVAERGIPLVRVQQPDRWASVPTMTIRRVKRPVARRRANTATRDQALEEHRARHAQPDEPDPEARQLLELEAKREQDHQRHADRHGAHDVQRFRARPLVGALGAGVPRRLQRRTREG